MERKWKYAIPIILALTLLLVMPPISVASAPPAEVMAFHAYSQGDEGSPHPGPNTKNWTDTAGNMHAEDEINTGAIWGDINGRINGTLSAIAYPSGITDAWAKGFIYVGDEKAYTISMVVTLNWNTGYVSGSFVIRGVGIYKGIHIVGKISSLAPFSPVSCLDGIKFTTNPHKLPLSR